MPVYSDDMIWSGGETYFQGAAFGWPFCFDGYTEGKMNAQRHKALLAGDEYS